MSARKLQKLLRDPALVVDYIYFLLRGVRVRELTDRARCDHGALAALAALAPDLRTRTIADAFPEDQSARDLAALLLRYGSDKASKHDYYLLYAALLNPRRSQPIRILEIGLGTNDTSLVSHMGASGRPGASLRAFRDWAPNAKISGADIDVKILFEEERIDTHYVDQTDVGALDDLARRFPRQSFDLIIDDGLHNPWANLNTLRILLPLLTPGGAFVIEDILESDRRVFGVLPGLLSSAVQLEMFESRSSEYCLLVRQP